MLAIYAKVLKRPALISPLTYNKRRLVLIHHPHHRPARIAMIKDPLLQKESQQPWFRQICTHQRQNLKHTRPFYPHLNPCGLENQPDGASLPGLPPSGHPPLTLHGSHHDEPSHRLINQTTLADPLSTPPPSPPPPPTPSSKDPPLPTPTKQHYAPPPAPPPATTPLCGNQPRNRAVGVHGS